MLVWRMWRFDPVQDHVHDRDDVGEGLLLLAVEGARLEDIDILGSEVGCMGRMGRMRRILPILPIHPIPQILKRLAQETRRAARAVVDAVANLRLDDLDDGADERARGVILAAVAPGVAHVFDLGLVEVGKLVLLGLGAEAEFVNVVNDLPQVVAALNLVLNFAEDFADLVFNGVRTGGALLEPVEVGEEFAVDEIAEVVAGHGLVVVELAVPALGRGPRFPAAGLVEDEGGFLPIQFRLHRPILFQPVKVFEEQQPGSLLGVIEFRGAAGFFPEHVVNVSKGLFKHRHLSFAPTPSRQRKKTAAQSVVTPT